MTRTGKAQLIDLVAKNVDLPKVAVRQVLEQLLAQISDQLSRGNAVTLPGFGSWRMRVQKPRVSRSVRDGQRIAIPARTRVTFKAGSTLKKATESSIDPEVFFGDGVAAATELDRAFLNLFGDLGDTAPDLKLDAVRARIQQAIGPDAEREAFEFFEALWQWKANIGDIAELSGDGLGEDEVQLDSAFEAEGCDPADERIDEQLDAPRGAPTRALD